MTVSTPASSAATAMSTRAGRSRGDTSVQFSESTMTTRAMREMVWDPLRSARRVGLADGLGDVAKRLAGALRGRAHAPERLGLAEAVALHQQALRALDDLAGRQGVAQRVRLLPHRQQLGMAGAGGLDRRDEVGLAE